MAAEMHGWHISAPHSHSHCLTQSILLLEKFYGLIFIRLSETTTEEMMCAASPDETRPASSFVGWLPAHRHCHTQQNKPKQVSLSEWRYFSEIGIHNKSYRRRGRRQHQQRQRQISTANTHFYRIPIFMCGTGACVAMSFVPFHYPEVRWFCFLAKALPHSLASIQCRTVSTTRTSWSFRYNAIGGTWISCLCWRVMPNRKRWRICRAVGAVRGCWGQHKSNTTRVRTEKRVK